jgi:hypothetical protein
VNSGRCRSACARKHLEPTTTQQPKTNCRQAAPCLLTLRSQYILYCDCTHVRSRTMYAQELVAILLKTQSSVSKLISRRFLMYALFQFLRYQSRCLYLSV